MGRLYAECMRKSQGVSYRDARCRVHRTHVAPAILIAPIKRWLLYQCRRRGLSPPIPGPGVDQTDRYELFPRNWSASQSWRKKLTAFPLPLPVILYYSLAQNAREVKWWIGGKPNKLRDNRALSCCLSRSCLIVFFFYLFSFSLWILLSTFHTLFISVKYNRIRGKFEVISSLDFNPAQGSFRWMETHFEYIDSTGI